MSNRVYVGNLGHYGQKEELEEEFGKLGTLKDVWIARNPPGFAFVVYYNPSDAKEAVKVMDGKKICGTTLKVELANSEPSRESRRDSNGSDRDRRGPPPSRPLQSRSPPYRDSGRGPPPRGPPPRGPPPRGPPMRESPRDMRPPPDRGYASADRDRYRERPGPPPRDRYASDRPPRYEDDYPPRPTYRREAPSRGGDDRYNDSGYSEPLSYRDRYEDRNGPPPRRSPPRGPPPPQRGIQRRSPPRRQRSPPPNSWNGRSRSPLY